MADADLWNRSGVKTPERLRQRSRKRFDSKRERAEGQGKCGKGISSSPNPYTSPGCPRVDSYFQVLGGIQIHAAEIVPGVAQFGKRKAPVVAEREKGVLTSVPGR